MSRKYYSTIHPTIPSQWMNPLQQSMFIDYLLKNERTSPFSKGPFQKCSLPTSSIFFRGDINIYIYLRRVGSVKSYCCYTSFCRMKNPPEFYHRPWAISEWYWSWDLSPWPTGYEKNPHPGRGGDWNSH